MNLELWLMLKTAKNMKPLTSLSLFNPQMIQLDLIINGSSFMDPLFQSSPAFGPT